MSLNFLSEKEFKELKQSSQWNYVKSLHKAIKELEIRADKNCEECEKQLIDVHDLNIDYLFEDWRSCSQHCEECGIEERVFMCDLQFQLMNHIANSLVNLRERQNALAKLVFKRDEKGAELLEKIAKEKEKTKKREKDKDRSLYQ